MSEEIICPECSRVIVSVDGVCSHGADAPLADAPVAEDAVPVPEVVPDALVA